MRASLIIRNAEKSDFQAVYELINDLEQFKFDPDRQLSIFEQSLENPNIHYFVGIKDGIVVGFISFHIQLLLHHGCSVGEIQELIVLEQYRNQKIGEKLIKTILDNCPKWEVYQIEVTSSKVRDAAHRFYINLGFKDLHKKFTLQIEGNPLL